MALRHRMSFHRINKLGILLLSCDFDKIDWIEVQKLIHEPFRDCKLKLAVFYIETPLEGPTSGAKNTASDLPKAQTTDTGINQVLTWERQESRHLPYHLQGLPREV